VQRECDALAAEYRAPLPEGDAGLAVALQRWLDLRPRHRLEGFGVTFQTEEEIVIPTAGKAREELESYIEQTPALGLPGVATKLRYTLQFHDALDLDDVGGEALIEIIEREAARRH